MSELLKIKLYIEYIFNTGAGKPFDYTPLEPFTWLQKEVDRINNKTSNLSAMQRKRLVKLHGELKRTPREQTPRKDYISDQKALWT